MTALVGTDAQFHCAGTGKLLTWLLDGVPYQSNNDHGLCDNTEPTEFGVQSNLTVTATLQNNGTSVKCGIQTSNTSLVYSDEATLTVLPGMFQQLSLAAKYTSM